jgi:hypothetical protein
MPQPSPRLLPDAPFEVESASVLFAGPSVRRRGFPSLRRLPSGRLLLAFEAGTGPDPRNDAAIFLSHSDDDGATWDEPFPVYANPGWQSLPMGGLALLGGDRVRLVVGRLKFDLTLGGDEPITDWETGYLDSSDGGRTWSTLSPELRLFPTWTEPYGASNPHRLSDGRLLWATIGTVGRDEQWQSGVFWTDASGGAISPVTLIAAAPDRNYADTDLARLPDGRFLAVIREMTTRRSHQAWSADEGRTWTAPRETGFRGSNHKLFALRGGAIACAYREEDPSRRGVSVSITDDLGETWRFVGQLYAAAGDAAHVPGSLCGYPDVASLGDGRLAAVLHTYPDVHGRMDLHFLVLRDRS